MLFNYIFEIIYIFSTSKITQNAITHVNFLEEWNKIDEILKHSVNLDALLGINATITTIFITLAFFLLDVKTDTPDVFFWDLKVIFTQLLKIKRLMLNLILLVIPLIFWDLKIKLFILVFYIIGLSNIAVVLINSYKWIISVQEQNRQTNINFKNSLRRQYLMTMNDVEPITDVFASLMKSTSYTTINQLALSSLFRTKIIELRKNNSFLLYNQLWSVYLQTYLKEKDYDEKKVIVTLFDDPKYLNDFFKIFFSELSISLNNGSESDIDLKYQLNSIFLHTFKRKRIYRSIPILQKNLFNFIYSLNSENVSRFIEIDVKYFLKELVIFNKLNPDESRFNDTIPDEWVVTDNNLNKYSQTNPSDLDKFNEKVLMSLFIMLIDVLQSESDRPLNGITREERNYQKIHDISFKEYRQSLFEMLMPTVDPVFSGEIFSFIFDAKNDMAYNKTENEHLLFWHTIILLGSKYYFSSNPKLNFNTSFEQFTSFEELIIAQNERNNSEFISIIQKSNFLSELVIKKNIENIISYINKLDLNNDFEDKLINTLSEKDRVKIKMPNKKEFDIKKRHLLKIAEIVSNPISLLNKNK